MRLCLSKRVRATLCAADRELLDGTLRLLLDADLVDVAETFCARVVPPGCAFDRVVAGPDQLTDFMRLLLLELRSIADAPGWSLRLRRTRALDALAWCGFSEEFKCR